MRDYKNAGEKARRKGELRKWTVLCFLFAGLAVLGYALDRWAPRSSTDLQTNQSTQAPQQTDRSNTKISVKITGNVPNPGTYTMYEGDTVKDLVEKAGGLPEEYDKTSLPISLLSELFDGQLVVIP